MTVTREIVRAYRGFGASMQRQIDSGVTEGRILAYGVFASLITFVARAPSLIKVSQVAAATASENVSWVAIFSTNLITSFFFGLLLLYGLAAISHIIAKAFGGKGSFFLARLALFWSLLVISPLALISTVIKTAFPFAALETTLSIALTVMFVFAWITSLIIAEKTQNK